MEDLEHEGWDPSDYDWGNPIHYSAHEVWGVSDEDWKDSINYPKGDEDMPLVKGKAARTKEGFSENIKREMSEGKPQKQAVAIAYSEARRSKKKEK